MLRVTSGVGLCLVTAVVFPTAASLVLSSQGPVIREVAVASGRVAGSVEGAMAAFKGIPFALPPVGERRWTAPAPAAAWAGVRQATAFAPSCIQTIVEERKPWTYEFMTHGEISEDCLYLNVWTPASSPGAKLPVFVYIYGGGNNEGSGAVPAYDGTGLASKGLVVVTFNYRVGVLGFFAHPGLSKEAAYHASGNYGLLDQIAAVRWVHDNIAGFGGDPSRITIAGQSAGASGVHSLTASPLAKGTFHRAIAQSGSPGSPRPLADLEEDGARFAAAKGAASLAALRAMSWQEVVAPVANPAAGGRGGAGGFRWSPIVDGYALPAAVTEVFAKGQQNDVPTITGANADEGGASPQPTATVESFTRQAQQRYGDLAGEFLALYPASTDQEARRAANDSARDQARFNLYRWAQQRGRTARTKAYTYFWTHTLPGPDAATYGAFHTSEVLYTLNTLRKSPRPFTDDDRRIADRLSSYWANFAATGDPNGKDLPRWPAVGEAGAVTMQVGDEFGPMAVASEAKLRFYEKAAAAR